jgi:hypothetical protein
MFCSSNLTFLNEILAKLFTFENTEIWKRIPYSFDTRQHV